MNFKINGYSASQLFETNSFQELLAQGEQHLEDSVRHHGLALCDASTMLANIGLDAHYGTEWSLPGLDDGSWKIALRLCIRMLPGDHFRVQLYLALWPSTATATSGYPGEADCRLVHRLAGVTNSTRPAHTRAEDLTKAWTEQLEKALAAQDLQSNPPEDLQLRWKQACECFLQQLADMAEP